jgi:hypothetical protein
MFTIEPWLTELPTSTELPTVIATTPTRPPSKVATRPQFPPSVRLTAPPSFANTLILVDPASSAAEREREEQSRAQAAIVAGVAVAAALATLAALVLFGLCLYRKLRGVDKPESSPATACKQDLESHAVHPNTELVKV